MNSERPHGTWIIVLSLVISVMLAVIPLPSWATFWRPDWTVMVLIYWCIAIPHRVGAITGWLVGIIHDLLNDTLLGQQALGLCLVAYLSVKLHKQIRLYPLWQQAIVVGGLIAMRELLGAWIQYLVGHSQAGWTYFYPALTSMILWPWLFVVLRDFRRTYRVN